MLSGLKIGKKHDIAYYSRTSKTERNDCVNKAALFAFVSSNKHSKHYLLGRNFIIRTDRGSLRWLVKIDETQGHVDS